MQLLIEPVHAQTTVIPPDGTVAGCDFFNGDISWNCIPNFIQYLATFVVGFTLAICLLLIIINGYKYMLGPVFGEGSNEAAKKGILNALLGAAVALLAYLIVDTIFAILAQ